MPNFGHFSQVVKAKFYHGGSMKRLQVFGIVLIMLFFWGPVSAMSIDQNCTMVIDFMDSRSPLTISTDQIRSITFRPTFSGPKEPADNPSTLTPKKVVNVNGVWEALNPASDGRCFIKISTVGQQFNATCDYVSKGKPYHWKMTGTITAEGKVVATMIHSADPKPSTYKFQLSPDGKKFTGMIGTWVRTTP